MIIGTGVDLCEVHRIREAIERHGRRIIERVYTEREIAYAESKANKFERYAARFAAKEACAKALGTGLRKGVFWRDMGVVNLPGGKPGMKLTGGALARLRELTPAAHCAQIDLSITDDFPLAQAIVVISAVASSPQQEPKAFPNQSAA